MTEDEAFIYSARQVGDSLAAVARKKSEEGDHSFAAGLYGAAGVITELAGRYERLLKDSGGRSRAAPRYTKGQDG